MPANIGSTDRMLRLVVGIVLVVLGLWLGGAWLWAAAVGAVVVVTALIRFCPVYTLLHIRTNKT